MVFAVSFWIGSGHISVAKLIESSMVARRHILFTLCSVPQGSVLGLRMFILYAADLEDVAAKQGINIHGYAEDMQLYLHGRRNDMTSNVHRLENCITAVGQWMSAD